jgi:hypothetical protein
MRIAGPPYLLPLLAFATLLATLLPMGCAGGAPAPTNGDDPSVGDSDIQNAITTGDALGALYQAQCAAGTWDSNAFAAQVGAMAGIGSATANATSGDVTVVYDSGIMHLFHAPHDEGPTDDLPPVEAASSSEAAPRAIPFQATHQATVGFSLDSTDQHFGRVRSACASILRSARTAGYQTPRASFTADVDWFRSWSDYSLIFVEGHGGYGEYIDAVGDRQRLFCIETTQDYRSASAVPSAYADDLANGRLIFMHAPGQPRGVLAITREFLSHHVRRLPPDSVVFINSCYSADTDDNICSTVRSMGAQLVFGWNGPGPLAHAADWAAYFFDRFLGGNDKEPQDPPTRPFAADEVYAHMQTLGHTQHIFPDTGLVGTLTASPPFGSEEILSRPILHSGVVIPPRSRTTGYARMILGGQFGSDRGEVYVGGTLMRLISWSDTSIEVELPDDGAGSTGDVTVRIQDLESNPMQLTRFEGDLVIEVESPGQYSGTVDLDLNGRGLVHLRRDEVDAEPVSPLPAGRTYWVLQEGGQFAWDISGDWTDGEGGVYGLDAHGSIWTPTTSTDPGGVMWAMDFDPVNEQYRMNFLITVTGTYSYSVPGVGSGTREHALGFMTPGYTDPEDLREGLVVPTGSYSSITPDGTHYTMTWNTLTPTPLGSGWDAYPASARLGPERAAPAR